MNLGSTRRQWLLMVITAAALAAVLTVTAQIPDQFTNLKVLPEDIAKKELVDTMKAFTFALGTRCWYCHDGEGDDLSTYDFPADVKEAKEIARRHVEMTGEINAEYFDGKPAVNCMTCHQGQTKPSS